MNTKITIDSASPEASCGLQRPENFFLLMALVFGLLFAVLTAPFQSPDEPAHFLRAWQLAQGQLVAEHYGGSVPSSLRDCCNRFEPVKFHDQTKVSWQDIGQEFHRPLLPLVFIAIRRGNSRLIPPWICQSAILISCCYTAVTIVRRYYL